MILLLDNRDSFVHSLARYVEELGETPLVRRSDTIGIADIDALAPTRIIISPGPCTPLQAGVSTDAVRAFGDRIPILGVCLGAQCIGAAYGARVTRASRPAHGKVSRIQHDGTGVLAGVPSPFVAARYHSLAIARDSLPEVLRITAVAEDGEVMAVAHRDAPVYGVQFHPESAATEYGYWILRTFLAGAPADPSLPITADLGGTHADGAPFVLLS